MRDHELRLCLTSVGQTLIQKKYATIDQILEMMEKDGIEGRTWHHFYHLCSEEALAKFKEKEITAAEAFAMDYDDLFYLINPALKFTGDIGDNAFEESPSRKISADESNQEEGGGGAT